MSDSFADDFLRVYQPAEQMELPDELAARFEIVERLAQSERAETFLLAEKKGGKKYVLKCSANDAATGNDGEADFLRNLSHKGLPVYETRIETGDAFFSLREYAEGITLGQFLDEHGLLDTRQALSIATDLCSVLTYLHTRPVPIIHRDINPANIIINPENLHLTLIDFDISRAYSDGDDTDAVYYGTKKFSPPEQYGFSQTDCRTDIYAVGILLRFLLTGSTDGRVSSAPVARIIVKCTELDPKRRYQNAAALSRALRRASVITRFRMSRALTLLFCALLVTTGVLCGALFFSHDHNRDDASVTFFEPMIERAVRASLGVDADEILLPTDLLRVRTLFIAGQEVYAASFDAFNVCEEENRWNPEIHGWGDIEKLDDVAALANLRLLYIAGQRVTDIAPLAGLPLEAVALSGNPLSDISPLRDCAGLMKLTIDETQVADVSPLSGKDVMWFLGANDSKIASLAPLSGMKLTSLFIRGIPASDYEVLAKMPELERVDVSGVTDAQLEKISGAASVVTLHLNDCRITDLTPLTRMKRLEYLIYYTDLPQDVSPFADMLNLKRITTGEDNVERIRDELPNLPVEFVL